MALSRQLPEKNIERVKPSKWLCAQRSFGKVAKFALYITFLSLNCGRGPGMRL